MSQWNLRCHSATAVKGTFNITKKNSSNRLKTKKPEVKPEQKQTKDEDLIQMGFRVVLSSKIISANLTKETKIQKQDCW